ncbi:MAG: hypothetical protein K9L77_02290 [Candidatus Omnitrophica bacterium]|nr:hypothetical protein [Candidatus Omnitrophota bacterium]MCF7876824.1 hypothetical protein [Candidatus Omnitrophota bacterium]MCF7892977.1 hypothetical protein [Candidatus Omnitrophota bacterium]
MSKRAENKRKNCLNCNKSLRRIDWYYRNNGYFCNKSCFRAHQEKKQAEQKSGKKEAKKA